MGGLGNCPQAAHEPIVMARKPIEGSIVDNVLKHGTGWQKSTLMDVELHMVKVMNQYHKIEGKTKVNSTKTMFDCTQSLHKSKTENQLLVGH